jgi:hypothetical protein
VAIVAFTPLKEETSAEVSLVSKVLGRYTGDCRLASACYTVQLEYTFTTKITSLGIYLLKEFHSGALIVSSIVFFVVAIKHGIVSRP